MAKHKIPMILSSEAFEPAFRSLKVNRQILFSRWVMVLLAFLVSSHPVWAQGSGHKEFFPSRLFIDLVVEPYQDGIKVTDALSAVFGDDGSYFIKFKIKSGKVYHVEVSGEKVVITDGVDGLLVFGSEQFTFSPPGTPVSLKPQSSQGGGAVDPVPISIRVSNEADSFALTCDQRFAIVVGYNTPTPVSLVDLEARKEVDTFPYRDESYGGSFVATCDDGESALVLFFSQDPAHNSIRRLTIAEPGKLTDTKEVFTPPNPSPNEIIYKVFAVPGSKVGVAVTGSGGHRLITFSIPGLLPLDSVQIAGGADAYVSAAVTADGTKVFSRSSRGDVIEGFTLDPVTGQLGATAFLTINDISPAYEPGIFGNALALLHDGTRLIVPEAANPPTPGAPMPRVSYFDTTTGARLAYFTEHTGQRPGLVGTIPNCVADAGGDAAPRLEFNFLPTTGLVLSWPTNATGFNLQSAFNLTSPVTWIDSVKSPAAVGAQFTVTNVTSGGMQFYRLRKL